MSEKRVLAQWRLQLNLRTLLRTCRLSLQKGFSQPSQFPRLTRPKTGLMNAAEVPLYQGGHNRTPGSPVLRAITPQLLLSLFLMKTQTSLTIIRWVVARGPSWNKSSKTILSARYRRMSSLRNTGARRSSLCSKFTLRIRVRTNTWLKAFRSLKPIWSTLYNVFNLNRDQAFRK
jgi:hypothetical protein